MVLEVNSVLKRSSLVSPVHSSLLHPLLPAPSLEYPDGYSAFALSTLPSAMAAYKQTLTEKQAANATRATSDALGALNDARFGLLPYLPKVYSWAGVRAADVVLNSWAAWLAASWPQEGIPAVSARKWQCCVCVCVHVCVCEHVHVCVHVCVHVYV